jgi:hypothetical protein
MATNINRLDEIEVDDRSPMDTLPYWARATNPIVRRHLGLYWRTLPPELQPILYFTGGWIVALLIGIFLPFITDIATMLIVVSIMVIPIAMFFYVRALFSIAANSAAAMSDEMRNKTMHLLMSTPMSLDQILLGKVAASIWRKMDDLTLIVQAGALFGPPLIIMQYAGLFPLADSGIISYPLIISMILVALGRLVLEPVMFGMLGVGIGTFVPYRGTAMMSAVALVGFYFLLMYMMTQLSVQTITASMEAVQQATDLTLSAANSRLLGSFAFMITVDFVLPLLLPYTLIRLMIRIVRKQVQSV